MKSAFELALERTGGSLEDISSDKKEKITEIDNKYKSKEAEAELAAQERIIKAQGNLNEIDQIRQDLTVELASIRSKAEKEKSQIRNG